QEKNDRRLLPRPLLRFCRCRSENTAKAGLPRNTPDGRISGLEDARFPFRDLPAGVRGVHTMDQQMDVRTLRQWLEEKRPVIVLDVRLDEDREQWSIPGSIHINAYEALKAGRHDLFSNVPLPVGVPVVTVCNRG